MNRRWGTWAGIIAGVTLGGMASQSAVPQAKAPAAEVSFQKDLMPALKKYCASCHQTDPAPGSINPFKFKSQNEAKATPKDWERILKAVKSGHMPPRGMPQPSKSERDALVRNLERFLVGECGLADPGRVTIRRLNRAEYAYTVRDLLGVDFDPSDDFPNDDVGYGFDNIGDVLTVSPLLMEKYLDAAEVIARQAIRIRGESSLVAIDASQLAPVSGGTLNDRGYVMYTNAETRATLEVATAGDFRVKIRAAGDQAGPDPCRMVVQVGTVRQVFHVRTRAEQPTVFEFPVPLSAGKHEIRIAFTNDYYRGDDPNPQNRDRNLILHEVQLQGPLGATSMPETHRRLIPANPAAGQELATARKYLAPIATRAFRRPVKADEMERLMAVVNVGHRAKASFEEMMQLGLTAIFVSPNFLFRAEIDPSGTTDRPLTDYELAARLSYFLWSSTPDAELMRLAGEKKLRDPKVLETQVDRMLKDPRSKRLAETFAAQWLQLGKLKSFVPDRKLFKSFAPSLKEDMKQEAMFFFNDAIANDRSLMNFLEADYTFVNERLANHYGLPGVKGENFRRVTVDGIQRGGLIGMGGIILINSNPTRTSPTKRGRWILEQILGEPPPPPPPGVDVLKPESNKNVVRSLREQMIEHRKNPECANCHAKMDPMGFSLENYDAVGQWRTEENGQPIDVSGELPEGQKFNGPEELRHLLLAKKGRFVNSFAEKMLTFATGRGMTVADNCHIETIVKRAEAKNYRLSEIIKGVVLSVSFRERRPEARPIAKPAAKTKTPPNPKQP